MHNEGNVSESSPNHPPTQPGSMEKLSSRKPAPDAKTTILQERRTPCGSLRGKGSGGWSLPAPALPLPRDSSSPLNAPAWNKVEKSSCPAPGLSKRKGAQGPGLSPGTLNRFLGKESRALGLPLAIPKASTFPSYIPPFPTKSECISLLTRATELN